MLRIVGRSALVLCAAVFAAACGSTSAPTSPGSGGSPQLEAPVGFRERTHKINADGNEVLLTWVGESATYRIVIDTASTVNVLTEDVTGNAYTWKSPRAGGTYYARVAARNGDSVGPFSNVLSLYVVDIRDMIDAMYFRAGPMADEPSNATANPVAAVWADGTRLTVQVSSDATDIAAANARAFVEDYAGVVSGAVTADVVMTDNRMQDVGSVEYPAALSELTIGIRVQSGVCAAAALACANYGPAPVGPNKSIVTLNQAGSFNLAAVAHELGHAYGIGHVKALVSGPAEFSFMMHPSGSAVQLSDAEKLAIVTARAGGMHAGMRRSEAQGQGLVNPYTGTSNVSAVRGASSERRDRHGWIWVSAHDDHDEQSGGPTAVTAPKAAPSVLSRWFDMQTGTLSMRYRRIEMSDGVVSANQLQYQAQLKSRFKFDAKGRLSVTALFATGNSFTLGWNSSGIGTGDLAMAMPLKQLFITAVPVSGAEVSFGSLGFMRGESTEITTYDNDGYITGERASVRRPKVLYFDELAATSAFLGDTTLAAFWDRANLARRRNYFQYFASKKFTTAFSASADYTRYAGVGTIRFAGAVKLPHAGIIDSVRYEQYVRRGTTAAHGFTVTGDKAVTKRLTAGLGFANIDAGAGTLNADRFAKGRRIFETATFKVTPELSFQLFMTQAVKNPYPVSNRFRYDVIAAYNVLGRIQRAGHLK